MKNLLTFLVFIATITLNSCKKDKLSGKEQVLVGTWVSIPTVFNCGYVIGTPINPNLKLELKERGVYKLYEGNKIIESGGIIILNGVVTFSCKEKNSKLNGREIIKFNSDSINIDRNPCYDEYLYKFIKNDF